VSPLYEVLFAGPISAVTLRAFAVWCAQRTWHVVDLSPDYDLDAHARQRFAQAVTVARREAHGHATSGELMAAWMDALDQRAAATGWWPERLASRGAFTSAAQMAARFGCRTTCDPDATTAALSTSRWTAWAVGYVAASASGTEELRSMRRAADDGSSHGSWTRAVRVAARLAAQARRIEEAAHADELRRWMQRQ
jgi:hypothetical protein